MDKDFGFTKYTTGPPRNRHWTVDTEGHGTRNAGAIGAHGKNHLFGVAPDVDYVSVKIMMNNQVTIDWLVEGIDWCIGYNNNEIPQKDNDDRIHIMYMGFSYGNYYESVDIAINNAWNNGMLLVASAGHLGVTGPDVRYPANFENVIAVSAANTKVDGIYSESRYGEKVALIAPGENIYTTYIDDFGYTCRNGTAYSAGFVAGAAALVWSANTTLSNKGVLDALLDPENTEDLGLGTIYQGAGLVRADKALGLQTGHIFGDVMLHGTPIYAATITATKSDIPEVTYSTTSSGTAGYHLIVPPGEYQVKATYGVNNLTFTGVIVSINEGIKLPIIFGLPPTIYTISASAGEGGTIAPSGEVEVNEGANQTFSIAADVGYQISDVLVDNSSVGAVSSYTFENVLAQHAIHASFEEAASIPLFIDRFDLTNTGNPQFARFTVYWELSGENLSTVEVVVTGPNNDSRIWNVSGSNASGTHEFSFRRGHGKYTVTLTVTDANGNISEKKEITL